jgi:hypothetical protein
MTQSVQDILQQLQVDFPPWCVAVAFREGSSIALKEALDDFTTGHFYKSF